MPYLGKQPASVPVTADDIPNDSITTAKIVDAAITIADIGPNAVGSSEMADDAIGLNELSATGTTNTSTFLRGDNSWAVPPTPDISGKLNLSGGTMTGNIAHAGDFTLDVGGDILLDADGADVRMLDGGTDYIKFTKDGNNSAIKAQVSDGDLILRGSDNGAQINALTLDMSEAGYATFNNWLKVNDRVVGNSNLVLNTSDSNEKIHLDASGYIKLETAGSERMRINSSGNVGIGVVPESHNSSHDALQVGGNGNWTVYGTQGAGGEMDLQHNAYFAPDGNDKYISTDEASKYRQGGGKHQWYTAASGSGNVSWINVMTIGNDGRVAINQTGNATAMQVSTSVAAETTAIFQGGGTGAVDVVDVRDSGGNSKFKVRQNGKVGIGETTPLGTVHIKTGDSGLGSINSNFSQLIVEGNTTAGMSILTSPTHEGVLAFSDSGGHRGLVRYAHANDALSFATADVDRLTIDNEGRVLIGTTSANIVNNKGLRVRADHYGQYAAQIAHRKDNGDAYGLDIDIENYTGTAGQIMIRFQTSGGAMGNIKATQNAVQYNSNSDYRLKENVDYTWDATTRLKQLKPARFNFKNDDTNTLVDGFLAHEVSSVVPNAINGEKDATETFSNVVLKANGRLHDFNVTEAEWEAGKLTDEYDSDSTWVASHTQDVNQEMDNSKLVPLLVKAMQEQQTTIEALTARITALEG